MAECIPLIYNTVQLSEEENMAKFFCQKAKDYFDGIDGKVFAVPSLRKGRDMDLIVWMHFDNFKKDINTGFINNPNTDDKKEYKRRAVREIWFNSALLVLEIKKHSTQASLSIRNGKLYVRYGSDFHNASDQNFEQVFPLLNFLGERLNIPNSKIPKIQNFIWLNRCIEMPQDYDELDNVIYGPVNIGDLIEQLCRLIPPVSFDEGKNITFSVCKPEVIELMDNYFEELRKEKANGLGIISRKKLDIILKKEIDIDKSQRIKEIGTKITLIKGNPGTGKTVHLIHIAYYLRNDEYKPIILTYNKALVQDINRMMHFSGYDGAVEIKTIHSFFYGILLENRFIDTDEFSLQIYELKIQELIEFIGDEVPESARKALNIKVETVLIDEAQDCNDAEKELILKLFGQGNIVLSIGNRQIVREKQINWTENISGKEVNVMHLKTSHRNKKDLVDIFNAFSSVHLNIFPWELRENRLLTGGKLNIMLSSAYSKSYHSMLTQELINEGNSMYDLMFLTPSETNGINYAKELSNKLDSWEIRAFNNTIQENKEKIFPVNEHRLLNYQSCRGLEAWILVAWNLDIIIQNIRSFYKKSDSEGIDNIKLHINNWLLMIFTRAIDTLVITFENMNSEEAKMILDLVQSDSFGHMAMLKN